MAESLNTLIRSLDSWVAGAPGPRARAERCADGLAELLGAGFELDTRALTPDPRTYRQHLLHIDPAGRYSAVALVWLPGQRTPIHDHVAWCVTAVLTGAEREESFRLGRSGGRPALLPAGVAVAPAGRVGALVPPGGDIHRVANDGDEIAVSLHVYGADISVRGSSINKVYDLPVADDPAAAGPDGHALDDQTPDDQTPDARPSRARQPQEEPQR